MSIKKITAGAAIKTIFVVLQPQYMHKKTNIDK